MGDALDVELGGAVLVKKGGVCDCVNVWLLNGLIDGVEVGAGINIGAFGLGIAWCLEQ